MHRHTIIGMAGHIDHGKTALIKALTGIETDTLKEEQLRKITIDIGFAYWKDNVTIIDVPGHERFVKNMVAGVSTVDLFLLIIAADDGVMPQTVEHLEILKFFGVRKGIAVINKIDLVDPEWLELIKEDVSLFLKKHGYSDVPILTVSALSRKGVDSLRAHIEERIKHHNREFEDRPFRLNIDRSFSAKGFGSIITGTVLSSHITTGQQLQVLPEKLTTKVRGLQVHQKDAKQGYCGQRVAINLGGLEVSQLSRGNVLVEPGSLDNTEEIVAEVHPVLDMAFRVRRHMEVRVHLGTDEIPGKMNWFEDEPFGKGEKTYHVRLKLERTASTAPGDAVLIRSISPVTTLAGGRVLEINPSKIKRDPEVWIPYFSAMKSPDISERLEALFTQLGYQTLTILKIKRKLFVKEENIVEALKKLTKAKKIIDFSFKNDVHYLLSSKLDEGLKLITEVIESRLEKGPYKKGLNFGEIKDLLGKTKCTEAFLFRALQNALNKKIIFFDGEHYTTEKFKASGEIQELKRKLDVYYLENRFSVSSLSQLAETLECEEQTIKNLTSEMAKEKILCSVQGQFYIHRKVFGELIQFLKEAFRKKDTLTIADVKEFTGSTRKYIVPLMEFLDNRDYTIRDGDLREKGSGLSE